MSDDHAAAPAAGKKRAFVPPGKHHEEDSEGWLVSYADMMTLLVGFFVIMMTLSTVDQDKFDKVRQAATKEFGGSYQVPFGDVSDRIREKLTKLGIGDQVTVKQNPNGVDIEFLGTAFFDTGSPDFTSQGTQLLGQLIPIIQAEPQKYNLVIEGHTDDIPVIPTSAIHSNWELSSVRACRVLEAFEGAGFAKAGLNAIGYGDSRPAVPNRDAEGVAIPKNQSQNRRVVVKMVKPPETVTSGATEPASGKAPELVPETSEE